MVGGGKEPEFKVLKLLDAKARTSVLAERFTPDLRRLASRNAGTLNLVKGETNATNLLRLLDEKTPFVVFISTGDSDLDQELAEATRLSARRPGIICVVDDPRLNDFNMPAIAELGNIRIGISTGGMSPAMASLIRQRIENLVTTEDIRQVRLQGEVRGLARRFLKDAAKRKSFAYKVIGDRRIGKLLKDGKYPEAKKLADRMLRSAGKVQQNSGKKGRRKG